jgi:hypothetical protein
MCTIVTHRIGASTARCPFVKKTNGNLTLDGNCHVEGNIFVHRRMYVDAQETLDQVVPAGEPVNIHPRRSARAGPAPASKRRKTNPAPETLLIVLLVPSRNQQTNNKEPVLCQSFTRWHRQLKQLAPVLAALDAVVRRSQYQRA